MKQGQVVVIGLDAFDPGLAAQWAAAGKLPTLSRLFAEGTSATVDNPFGLFVGALWVNFASALRADRHGFHCWDEIDPRTYRWRRNPPKADSYPSFWKMIADQGRRVAAIDVPHSRAPSSLNGVELVEWGCHDRHFGLHSAPPEWAPKLAAAYGFHPTLGVAAYERREFAPDDFGHRSGLHRTAGEERALLDGLRTGARVKGQMLEALIAVEDWDLFIAVFGESHAVGHQLYHLHNPDHDWFSGDRQEALGGDPLLQVYQEIDASVGRLLASVKRDATVLIHLSHGMTDHNDGTHLLDEVLKRLERGSPKPTALDPLQKFFQRSTPTLRRFASAWRVPGSLRQFIAQAMRAELPAGRARRRYYLTPNNFVCSGIRLNLIGREPQGKVRADEVDEVCRSLERDLLELINVATGKPAIRAVVRSDAYHRRRPQDTIPDLFVDWDRSAAIEEVASAKVGTVRRPYTGWRSGDHRPEGLLIVTGPDIPRGTTAPPLAVEDIGPSIASRLGVQLQGVDGEVVHWLAGCAMSAGPGTEARHS